MKTLLASEHWDPQWRKKLSRLITYRKKAQALRLLNKLIDNSLPLFSSDERVIEERHLAWLFKIDLLREWGRISEALAWICLECELYPSNVTAQALKEQLKRELDLRSEGEKREQEEEPQRRQETDYWQGIAGMRELKSMFERDVILPLHFPQLYAKYRVPMPNGVLLYGPPGCGKTMFARKAAQGLGYHYIEVKASDLASIYVHGTQQMIGKLFEEAASKAPSLIFFDEIDAFVPNRGEDDVSYHYRAEVNEFLSQLNGSSKRGILVLGATNLISRIDPAILRPGRMDKRIFVSPPDYEARVEAFKLFMKDRPQDKIDWHRLAEYSECCTYAELEYLVNEAARNALQHRRNIMTDDLIESLSDNPATHTSEQVEAMRKAGENK
jgi:transitional endoplasmic reticulum ATPase